ncbi:MAG: hypothetical protein ILO10_08065 [Kiritimatiellae bacterium]|nr:hypothetical protein [Kiritimatiellia bacterium]
MPLTATYVGPAYTNAPMTATDTSTIVLGDTVYTHDANGNLTGDATFIYQYDTANQLTNVIRKADNTRVLSCRYDALGRHVEAIRADGTTDRYVYFPGSFLVLAVLDGSNNPKEFYTRGPDLSGTLDSAGGIGGILACTYATAPTAPLYHHAELMGNVIILTDTSSTLAASFRYTSFGQLVAPVNSLLPRFLFSSKEFETGLNIFNYGFRVYSLKTGRWLQRDAFNEAFDMNLYRFVDNTPINIWDSLGLFPAKGKWYKQPLFGYQYDSRYYKKWLKKNPLTDKRIDQAMRKQLKRSCIGITCMNLGIYEGDPEITNCYSTIKKAEEIQEEWNKNCLCQGKASNGEPATAKIFGMKLWSIVKPNVDEKSGLVDLSEWKITNDLRYEHKYYFNRYQPPFDFGFFDEESGFVISGGGAGSHWVYYNDFDQWSKYMPINYNMLVYCVSCNTLRRNR